MTTLSHPDPIRNLPRMSGARSESERLAEMAWRDSWFSAHEFLASCIVTFVAGLAIGAML